MARIDGGMAEAVTHHDCDGAPSSFMLLASALGRCNDCGQNIRSCEANVLMMPP